MKELLITHGAIEPIDFSGGLIKNLALLTHYSGLHTVQEECMEHPTIPHSIHYIWLTDLTNPREAPEGHWPYVTDSMAALRNGTHYSDWNYYFHTNAPFSIPTTTDFFTSQGFTVRDITSHYPEFQTGDFIENIIRNKHYGLAVDLARYEVVNKEGGVYLDLNFNLTRALDHEVCAYSYVNFDTIYSGIDDIVSPENYFFISRPNHPILTHSINDIFTPFYGANAKAYWKNLNTTDDSLTQGFFGIFSFNNILHLRSNGEPGIIYSFLAADSDHNNAHSTSPETEEVCSDPFLESSEEDKVLLMRIREILHDKPRNLVCTNPHRIPPMGYDGENGGSWIQRDYTDPSYASSHPQATDESHESGSWVC